MAKVIIKDDALVRFNGTYELDPEVSMTSLEWRWVKKIAGYLPQTITEGFEGDDPDLYIALGVIAMHRAGKIRSEEAILVARLFDNLAVGEEGSALVMDFTDEEAEKVALADEEQAEGAKDESGEA